MMLSGRRKFRRFRVCTSMYLRGASSESFRVDLVSYMSEPPLGYREERRIQAELEALWLASLWNLKNTRGFLPYQQYFVLPTILVCCDCFDVGGSVAMTV